MFSPIKLYKSALKITPWAWSSISLERISHTTCNISWGESPLTSYSYHPNHDLWRDAATYMYVIMREAPQDGDIYIYKRPSSVVGVWNTKVSPYYKYKTRRWSFFNLALSRLGTQPLNPIHSNKHPHQPGIRFPVKGRFTISNRGVGVSAWQLHGSLLTAGLQIDNKYLPSAPILSGGWRRHNTMPYATQPANIINNQSM